MSEIILPSSNPSFIIRVDLSSAALQTLLAETFLEYEPYYLLESAEGSYRLTNLSEEQLHKVSSDNFSEETQIDGSKYFCFNASVLYGETEIHFFFSEDKLFTDTKLYHYLNLYLGLFTLLICVCFLWGSYTIIHKPIQTLINAFQNINNQDYSVQISDDSPSDFAYLYKEFNLMAQKLKTLIEKDYQQQLLLNKAELKQLQAQINPHFLYNSLFMLRRMIQDELYDEAYHISDALGLYFQYITRNSSDYMPLSREYHHAMLYCEIQKLRFEGRTTVETDEFPKEFSGILVPKLIIQPILENAFHYGLHNKVCDGLLKVSISCSSSQLTISIEDNGEDLSDALLAQLQNNLKAAAASQSSQEMTGILNIQRRLMIYFDGAGGLYASRSSLGGLCIQLTIPINNTVKGDSDL